MWLIGWETFLLSLCIFQKRALITSPLVLMLSAPVWYASCTVCREYGFHHGAHFVQYHCTQCQLLKMHCHQKYNDIALGSKLLVFIDSLICLLSLIVKREFDFDWWTIIYKLIDHLIGIYSVWLIFIHVVKLKLCIPTRSLTFRNAQNENGNLFVGPICRFRNPNKGTAWVQLKDVYGD